MEFPRSLFSDETRPDPSNYINYSSTFKTVKAVKDVVSAEVWEHVENSPLGVIIKYMNLKFAWSSILVHYILSRQLYCKKLHELWFSIEEQPVRFTLFEFEDITSLKCEPLPNAIVVEDVEKSNHFRAMFNLRHPRSIPSAEDILQLCRSPDVCRSWSREDQIRLYYLAILTGGLLGLDRRDAIPPAKSKPLMDLEIFEQYPWGRVAFVELVHQIKTAAESGRIKNGSYVCKGFVQVIQVWAYAYIPCIGEAIGHPISMDDVHPVWEHQDEDPQIENLLEFLRQDQSLGTITWQALPVYPLTPVICNKRRRRIHYTTEANPREIVSMERSDVGTLQNLTARLEALEQDKGQLDKVVNLISRVFCLEKRKHSKATDVREPEIGEDWDTRKRQPVPMEEEVDRVNESAETLALMGSKTFVVGTGDNQLKSLDDAKVQAFTGDEDEPHKASSNIIKPSKPIRKSTRVAALSEKLNTNYLVVYGPVDKAKVKALNAFVKKKRDSTYPHGDVLMAKDFFKKFLKPRASLSFYELDVPLALYKQRFSKNPDVFISPRFAILDAWLGDQSKIPKGSYDYYIGKRPTIIPPGKQWGRDVDTLYSVLLVGKCHWVLMAISIRYRTIKIYDSSTDVISKETIKEAAMPFAHMLPYVLYVFSDAEVKKVMDAAMYSIQFVTDGVPQSKPPYGDCGIYAVKFLECLVMGVPFADEHLLDSNMMIMRRKLAAEMYDETRQVFEYMHYIPYSMC
ncbi:hypothetical protein Bca52824_023428 [Brassica carinata]|uniref:Ubiquitin-like protease family profile domain-containing protein n=1 Tax=Brassica carinata TaxID=52824 RepID=A0A8X7VIQ1_BRACI|nr:hypothetical protein Bca52824_023428 [Brassica carinata]